MNEPIATSFTADQISAWRRYEKVRKGGRFNMFDPRAKAATGLPSDLYSFVMKHYSELKEAAK